MSTSTKTILTAAHWGPMLVETDGENVLSSRGALPTQHPNSLQTVVRDQVHSKTRVRWPMVRKGFLASPDKPQGIRGQDEFVRVSWDDALALIHTQHKRIRDSYGPSSIFAGSYGWRSNGVLHKASTLLQRYMSLAGGYTGHLGDYSTGAAQAIMDEEYGVMIGVINGKIKRVPLAECAGKLKMVSPDDQLIKEAKCIGISFGV